MTAFLYLSGESPPLAGQELLSTLRAMGIHGLAVERIDRIALIEDDLPDGLVERLGMCHFAGSLEGALAPNEEKIMATVQKAIEGVDPSLSLAPIVRMPKGKHPFTADGIFHAMEGAIKGAGRALRLRSPDRRLFVVVAERAYIGVLTRSSSRAELLSRRGSKLAFSRPVMMDPRISRTMVNLLGLPTGSSVLDPFMGPGGLIMEAARLGYDCCGIELDERVLEGASKNLSTENLGDRVKALHGDSRMIGSISEVAASAPFDGILTDPPFGRSSRVGGNLPGDLLRTVLMKARDVLRDGAPVVIDAPDGKMLEGIEGYRLDAVFKLRVHKSLTRHIGVLAAS